MIKAVVRKSLINPYINISTRINVHWRLRNTILENPCDWDFSDFKRKTMSFLDILSLDSNTYEYKYSRFCTAPTIYGSVYACLIEDLFGNLSFLKTKEKSNWTSYFNSFQSPKDGLFYDKNIVNANYADSDWWGARHLALHIIGAYAALGSRPKYPFSFLKKYYNKEKFKKLVDIEDWSSFFTHSNDIDNKLMNIGGLLQYQRDTWEDKYAGAAIEYLKLLLKEKINPDTGMWGSYNANDRGERSRAVQFAYHLLPIFFYDDDYEFDYDKIVKTVLLTQNKYGGFGTKPNSSACEDIDSIDLLVKFEPFVGDELKLEIKSSLTRAFKWVLTNQVDDGGFVFRLNEKLVYGHPEMTSIKNQGALFPTWFRILSIGKILSIIDDKKQFKLIHCPGYYF